jgi:hypothetical protein
MRVIVAMSAGLRPGCCDERRDEASTKAPTTAAGARLDGTKRIMVGRVGRVIFIRPHIDAQRCNDAGYAT